MNQDAARLLMLTVLGSLLLGVGVLIFDENYTVEKNVRSNKDYCPTIEPYWDASQRPEAGERPDGQPEPAAAAAPGQEAQQ